MRHRVWYIRKVRFLDTEATPYFPSPRSPFHHFLLPHYIELVAADGNSLNKRTQRRHAVLFEPLSYGRWLSSSSLSSSNFLQRCYLLFSPPHVTELSMTFQRPFLTGNFPCENAHGEFKMRILLTPAINHISQEETIRILIL